MTTPTREVGVGGEERRHAASKPSSNREHSEFGVVPSCRGFPFVEQSIFIFFKNPSLHRRLQPTLFGALNKYLERYRED